jgi:demethylmenaquinone methyltransferase/2-methoxy-6-polyprenyl-1,4-benzoquinol methylase
MTLWHNPKWFKLPQRKQQLDQHVSRSGQARFGLKSYGEDEKAAAVRGHFNRVAPKYDFMNSLLSFGIQHVWKRAAIRRLDLKPGNRILDLCGGTGDLAYLAAARTGPAGQVVICDINRAMLTQGRLAHQGHPLNRQIGWSQGDAEKLPFPDAVFDAAMVGFGIRNLTHLERGFQGMYRTLKPGGKFLCLEFSKPTNAMFRALYDFYSFNIMPLLGQLIAGSAESYACLPETIRMFPLPDELSAILARCGFAGVTCHRMTNSMVVAHLATKG